MRSIVRSMPAAAAAALLWGLGGGAALASAQDTNGAARTTIHDLDADAPGYRFLKLGVDVDYLRAERWRIVDQIESAIPPLYEPRLPFHGYTLPPGAWRIGLDVQRASNPGNFGRDDFYSMVFDEVDMRSTTVDLDVLYGFEIFGVNDIVARLNVPYRFQRTDGTGHPFRIDPMVMTMEGSGEGIGDVSLTVKKKWLDQGNAPLTFSTMTGIVFPTGDDHEEFNASQTLYMGGTATPVSAAVPGQPVIDVFGREAGDRLFPRVAQPGYGSWGGRAGLGATLQLERSALHAGAVFDFFAANDGIDPGDELRYGISYVAPLLPSDRVTFDFAVAGRLKGDERFPGQIMHPERDPATGGPIVTETGETAMFVTDRPAFEHGNIVLFTPALIFLTSPNLRLFVSPALRIRGPERGPSPRWSLTLGQTFTF